MSGIKPVELTLFYRALRARGLSQAKLADLAMTNRAHLSQVLTGKRPGRHTWRRIARFLEPEELALLQHRSTWKTEVAS
jgi:transcriptional regulator with XRE-family HTH domain